MFTSNLCMLFVILIFLHVISTQIFAIETENTTIRSSTTEKEKASNNMTSMTNPLNQGKEIIHDAFAKMDRGTIVRGSIVLAGITCLILMYAGVKALL